MAQRPRCGAQAVAQRTIERRLFGVTAGQCDQSDGFVTVAQQVDCGGESNVGQVTGRALAELTAKFRMQMAGRQAGGGRDFGHAQAFGEALLNQRDGASDSSAVACISTSGARRSRDLSSST